MYCINDFLCVIYIRIYIYMSIYMVAYLFDVYSLGYTSEVGFRLFNLFFLLCFNIYWLLYYLQLISRMMVTCKIMLLVYSCVV
jgi:hypothetical protein